ncbi:glycosyltransferase family 2 protein [Haliscomenobacter hydrossis]|uniref:Glycosyl transferase family 2 n=1 Tax=Haliscomenobacter hydrossis (strain ATCC 27775 / DSM 1100 / LMG 10767 / O) TaxID=760192 RepID=F4L463_HALH1|nr:glycosyltransferase family 2 protein [Haliscomenobacter hydrossis]AEE50761.1 glycosyl transferase family 2 [Haliscomenobacter hydrossis DSM 1100]
MKISIVTPAFNSAKTIRHTIESVARQTYPNVEYIVVDGGSRDATAAIVNRYSDVVDLFISEPDRGVYDAMNKGIRAATGDVIAILNSDDFYTHSHVLEQIVAAFQQSKADSIYGDLQYVDPENTHQVIRHWESGDYQRQSFLAGWMPPHPTFFVKREVYKRHGLFNLALKSSADYELMLRFLYKHEVSTAYVPDVLVRMRAGGLSNASWSNRWRANREDKLAWRINGLKPYFYTTILKPLRKLEQFFYRPDQRFTVSTKHIPTPFIQEKSSANIMPDRSIAE